MENMMWAAGEVCDPAGDDQYSYKITEVLLTDFVTPTGSHWDAKGPSTSRVL